MLFYHQLQQIKYFYCLNIVTPYLSSIYFHLVGMTRCETDNIEIHKCSKNNTYDGKAEPCLGKANGRLQVIRVLEEEIIFCFSTSANLLIQVPFMDVAINNQAYTREQWSYATGSATDGNRTKALIYELVKNRPKP